VPRGVASEGVTRGPPELRWHARGGALHSGALFGQREPLRFHEDDTHGLHGVFTVPPTRAGFSMLLRMRSAKRRACAIWVRPTDENKLFDAAIDFDELTVRSSGPGVNAQIGQLGPDRFEIWFALADPTRAVRRIDIMSHDTSVANCQGVGDVAFILEHVELIAPQRHGLLDVHAHAQGYAARVQFASRKDYFATFFTAERFNRVLAIDGVAQGSVNAIFETLRRDSDRDLALSPRDLTAHWLRAESADLVLDLTSEALLSQLDDAAFRKQLRTAHSLRAAIACPFPSDAAQLRQIIAAEAGLRGNPDKHTLQHSPRLLVARLLEKAGLSNALPRLAHVSANRICFDPDVLTTQDIAAPTERRGFVLIELARRA
jgi:hypothetical protein